MQVNMFKTFSALLLVALFSISSYYFFIFKTRQEYSSILLQACLSSLDLKSPQVNLQFFQNNLLWGDNPGTEPTGIWACENGAKNYLSTGIWGFNKK